MKTKDYKEIAKIIKGSKGYYTLIIIRLANYFEKENNKEKKKRREIVLKSYGDKRWDGYSEFNKKQFLKDCGVY